MARLFGSYNLTPPTNADGAAGVLQVSATGRLLTGHRLRLASAGFTRPADTTAYAAKDSMCNATASTMAPMEFTGMGLQSGVGGVIHSARIFKSQDSVTNANFRLHLYNATFTPAGDNAALTLVYADLAKYIGYIDFASAVDIGDHNISVATLPVPALIPYIPAATSLFGQLEALAAYTPASAETFVVHLWFRPD